MRHHQSADVPTQVSLLAAHPGAKLGRYLAADGWNDSEVSSLLSGLPQKSTTQLSLGAGLCATLPTLRGQVIRVAETRTC
jgi:hypothetical protein